MGSGLLVDIPCQKKPVEKEEQELYRMFKYSRNVVKNSKGNAQSSLNSVNYAPTSISTENHIGF